MGRHSVILRLLASSRKVRTKAQSLMRTAAGRPTRRLRRVPPSTSVSFSTAVRDDTGRLDIVAGSEFLDDRIRLRE